MKKILFIFFLLLILLLNNKKSVETTFNYLNYSKISYCIDVKDENVTTNNINNFFSDIEIESIYPYFNESYKKLIKNDLKFVPLNDFINYYKNISAKIGKNNWVSNYYLGIKLEKLKIKVYDYELNYLLKNYKFKLCNE